MIQVATPQVETETVAPVNPARSRPLRAKQKERQESRVMELLTYERALWAEGKTFLAGIDEVGAGPLAGPVVAACVVLDREKAHTLLGVDDSKKVPEHKRGELCKRILEASIAHSVQLATVEEIDQINILQASLLAMKRAVEEVAKQTAIEHLLIDARKLANVTISQTAILQGDAKSLSIAAASIVAKVWRDQWMMEAALRYPGYGLGEHKGYGTKKHLEALQKLGPTPIHRTSFAPVQQASLRIQVSE